MHEHTIANKIITDAKSYGKVKSLTIEVGQLAHLPAKEMKAILVKLTDWKIEVIEKKAIITCDCKYIGEPKIISHLHDNTIYECPKCKHSMPTILEGQDIILKDVEVEEEDDFEEEYEDDKLEEEEEEEE